jgi:integrase
MIDRGIDPLGATQERRGAPTLKEIAEQYIARYAAGKKSGKADTWYLRREVLPEWGSRKAVDIRKADVIKLVEAKAKTAPIAGNMLLSIVKGLFNWAIRVDLLSVNPAATVRPPAKKVARDRFLSETEIRIVWRGLDTAAMAPECRAALRLILVTGCRPGEACTLEWVDIQGDLWTLPASKAKQGRQHVIPLSSLAVEILNSGCDRTGRYVFPSPARKGRSITRVGLSQAVLLNREHFGIPRWTPHDCRRTCATHLPAPRFIKERVLGHADKGVTGIYDQCGYLPEKRAALQAWGEKIRSIIA